MTLAANKSLRNQQKKISDTFATTIALGNKMPFASDSVVLCFLPTLKKL